MSAPRRALPFSAVVGQDDAKLALLLAALAPDLGGVLLRGEKGSAKTTLARGLAALLPGEAPFVELPLGATEDRVLGSLDLGALLGVGAARFRPGLLAAAHGGVLYVDEVNLLADHLVDALLDAAATGVHRVERDGVSHVHPARFVLVGSMNPEEGDLRPQLLDRFGLAVDVVAPRDWAARAEAVARQLAVDAGGPAGASGARTGEVGPDGVAGPDAADAELRRRLAAATPARVPDHVVGAACRVALAVGAEGLRADLMLCRAAGALAAWDGRGEATDDDLRRVAPLVLAHRRRRDPFDPTGLDDDELEDAFARARNDPGPDPGPDPDDVERDDLERDDLERDGPPDGGAPGAADGPTDPPGAPLAPPALAAARRPSAAEGRRSPASGSTGRFVRDRDVEGPGDRVAVVGTALRVAARRADDPGAPAEVRDVRAAEHEHRTGNLVIVAVDTSGSMGADRRIAAAKGAVLGLLTDAYQRRDRVALIAFRGERAELVLRPTASGEIARTRLAELPVGGTTPLADALRLAHTVAAGSTGDRHLDPLLVVVTDGRATAGAGGDGAPDPFAQACAVAHGIRRAGVPAVVVDAEAGTVRLGLARELADHLGAEHVALDDLDGHHLERTIRTRLAARPPARA